MSLASLQMDDSVNNETDFVPKRGLLESEIYTCTVKMAYMSESSGGAKTLNLSLETADGRVVDNKVYLTSGRAKGQKNYSVSNKTGERNYLQGFNLGNSLAALSIGQPIGNVELEDKVLKIWDNDLKEEVPTTVPVFAALLGQPIVAGIKQKIVDAVTNVAAEGELAQWKPNGKVKEINEFDKFFRASDNLTTAEILAGITEGDYINTWRTNNAGKTIDESTVPSGATQSAAALSTPEAVAKPQQSIFG